MQQKQMSGSLDPETVTLPASPRSHMGVRPASTLRIHDHNQDAGSFGENTLRNRKGKSVLDSKAEHNVSKKELGQHELRNNNSLFNILMPMTHALVMNHDKPFISDNYGATSAASSLSCHVKDLKHDVARKNLCESFSQSYSKEDDGRKDSHHKSSLAEASGSEDNVVAEHGISIKSAFNSKYLENEHAGAASNSLESNRADEKIQHLASLPLCGRQCSDDKLYSEFRGRDGCGLVIVSQPDDIDKDETYQVSHKEKSPLIWYPSDSKMTSCNMGRCKEYVNSDLGDSISISKKREGSHESVESTSSKRPFSGRKRILSPELKISEVNSSKRHKSEKSCSGSSVRQVSSFMNWISTLTSGSIKFDQPTPLRSIPYKSPIRESHPNSLHRSHEKTKDSVISCRTLGFRSIFEAICLPSFTITNSSSRDLEIGKEVGASNENEFAREQLQCSLHMVCENIENGSCNVNPRTSVNISSSSKGHVSGESLPLLSDRVRGDSKNQCSTERLKHASYHVEELAVVVDNMFSKNSSYSEEKKCSSGKECHLNDKGSPSSKGKDSSIPISDSNGSLMAANPRSGVLESLWIKRLVLESSSFSENKAQHNLGTEAANNLEIDKCKVLDSTDVSFDREPSRSGYCQPLRVQDCSSSDETGDTSIFPRDPNGAKEICSQKVEPRLNQILPLKKYNKSVQMASIFAKRLDAIRHSRPSMVSDTATCSIITCFFCGERGHSIGKCSELGETGLDLLNNINSFDGTVESSCICILCFQLNHWAISCPHASTKRKYTMDNDFLVSSKNNRAKHKAGSPSLSNYVESNTLFSEGKQEGHQSVNESKNARTENVNAEPEPVAKSGDTNSVAKVPSHEVNSTINPVKEGTGECQLKMKPSRSRENKSKEKQIIPYCNIAGKGVDDSCREIFETIRRLRLSRSDVIRWMKLPGSHFSLEGLFVRIRFGKDEGFHERGYRVACIISKYSLLPHFIPLMEQPIYKSLQGKEAKNIIYNTKNRLCGDHGKHLSVCIGGSTSLIDYRSISNHDFIEEELEAWWSTCQKTGVKQPTLQELNKKVQQRLKFGF